MIEIKQITDEEYRSRNSYYNYSLIKSVSEGRNRVFLSTKEPSMSLQRVFDMGHILERYFLEDKDLSYIKIDKYKDTIVGQQHILLKFLINYCKENEIKSLKEITDDQKLKILTELQLFKNLRKEDLLLNKINSLEDSLKFHLSLKDTDVIADDSVFQLIEDIETGIKETPEVNSLLNPDTTTTKIFNQFTIFNEDTFNYPVKIRIDRLHVNEEEKHIDIIDFKTTELPADNFISAFYTNKYYYQLPFYTRVFLGSMPEYKDYTYSMKFIVVSKKYPLAPAIFVLPNTWIDKAWDGWTTKTGIKKKGIEELLEEIDWYRNYGSVNIPYILHKNDHILTIEEDWNV